jgi:hypothetical protein
MVPPNMRMKLSPGGGRLKGKGSIKIAAAAERSLCAIRWASAHLRSAHGLVNDALDQGEWYRYSQVDRRPGPAYDRLAPTSHLGFER